MALIKINPSFELQIHRVSTARIWVGSLPFDSLSTEFVDAYWDRSQCVDVVTCQLLDGLALELLLRTGPHPQYILLGGTVAPAGHQQPKISIAMNSRAVLEKESGLVGEKFDDLSVGFNEEMTEAIIQGCRDIRPFPMCRFFFSSAAFGPKTLSPWLVRRTARIVVAGLTKASGFSSDEWCELVEANLQL